MYMELTPEDTVKDLQKMLIDSIPSFEFPRKNLYDYKIETKIIPENEVSENDFVIGIVWEDLPNGSQVPNAIIEKSCFNCDLTSEEINILAVLMKINWLQRQIASIENTRLKYSGSDFKFTSQANHLSKLITLLETMNRESTHIQRLYRRRKVDEKTGNYVSNWSVLLEKSALD